MAAAEPGLRLRAFTSASGSAGTLGAGDYLKERYGAKIVAVEALECPTMLANGFGEHNIQGIGDKHIPLIHNVMNTDLVTGITDRATDQLSVLFAAGEGVDYLRRPAAGPRARPGGAAGLRAVQHLQHPGRREDGEVPASRAGRRGHHGGDGRRRHVRE